MIREVAPGDLAAIFSWWLRDLRDADPGPLPDSLWYPAHRAHIEQILASPKIQARVAAAADKPDEILGFAVAEPNEVLWWVHVRRGNLRGHGIAKQLLLAVQAGPGVKAAWTTTDGARRLRNPWRGRQVRRREAQLARTSTTSQ
jgi:hypothetical protein